MAGNKLSLIRIGIGVAISLFLVFVLLTYSQRSLQGRMRDALSFHACSFVYNAIFVNP